MSATPTYDAVVEELRIDPKRIAARPAWSFELAERVRKHQKKVLRSAAPVERIEPPHPKQAAPEQGPAAMTGAGQSRTKRQVAAS